MRRLVLKRLAGLPLLLVGITILTFLTIKLIPGDPAEVLAGGQLAAPEKVEEVRHELGLDDSLPTQYARYVGRLVQGDLGESIFVQRSVSEELRDRIPASVELTAFAIAFGIPCGLALGIGAARRRDSWIDNVCTFGSIVGLSVPGFWLALMLVWLFGVHFGVLPFTGRLPAFSDLEEVTGFATVDALIAGQWGTFVDALEYLVLPAVTLGMIPLALTARFARSAFVEELSQDYIRTARAFGLSERTIVWRYAAKNAMLPLVTLFGILVPTLLGSAVLIETVFAWPGVGTLLLQAIQSRDYAVVQSTTLVFAVIYVMSNLVVDLLYLFLDPRIKRS